MGLGDHHALPYLWNNSFNIRSKLEPASLPVEAGDRVVVGLTALRVLPNFTLTTERATRTVEMRT
jgi:hypothetical protein